MKKMKFLILIFCALFVVILALPFSQNESTSTDASDYDDTLSPDFFSTPSPTDDDEDPLFYDDNYIDGVNKVRMVGFFNF